VSANYTLNRESVTSLDTDAQLYTPAASKAKKYSVKAKRLWRRGQKRKTKIVLAQLLRAAGYAEKADDVLRCCSKYGIVTCGRHVARKIPTYRCRFRLCPDCAVERSRRAQARLLPRLLQTLAHAPHERLVFITLTAPNSFATLAEVHAQFREWFRRLRRLSRWSHRISGGIASFEISGSEASGWHYHAHILAVRRVYYSQTDLVQDWQAATSDAAFIVDIRDVQDVGEAVAEVLKYAFKPAELGEWSPAQVKEFIDMKGARFSSVFGNLHGMKVEEETDATDATDIVDGAPCPECGDPLFCLTVTADELASLEAGENIIQNKHGTVH
jgi:hypothetical protein